MNFQGKQLCHFFFIFFFFLHPSENGSALKGMNLLTPGEQIIPF